MIAFSCVHCGQRMKITQEDDGKKATCEKCGQVVLVPAAETPRRLRRESDSGERTTSCARVSTAPSYAETRLHLARPLHEEPHAHRANAGYGQSATRFLAPARRPTRRRLGQYRVLGVVGSGGMGIVLKAEDPDLGRVVALKVMLPDLAASAMAKARFLREARAAAAIQHDHVVTIHAVGEEGNVPFIVMPFLRGESLEMRPEEGRRAVAPRRACGIGREIATGLAAVHSLGLVHRDIKPANVWLEGESGRVKILDFGLVRGPGGDAQLTQDGAILGSPAFMAPEQGSRQPLDARADLFSLGCVLYLLATGESRLRGRRCAGDAGGDSDGRADPREPEEPEVAGKGFRAIGRLLAKKPQDRPETARAVVEENRGARARRVRRRWTFDVEARPPTSTSLPAFPRPPQAKRLLARIPAPAPGRGHTCPSIPVCCTHRPRETPAVTASRCAGEESSRVAGRSTRRAPMPYQRSRTPVRAFADTNPTARR